MQVEFDEEEEEEEELEESDATATIAKFGVVQWSRPSATNGDSSLGNVHGGNQSRPTAAIA